MAKPSRATPLGLALLACLGLSCSINDGEGTTADGVGGAVDEEVVEGETVEENCDDPVNCEGSEPVNEEPVDEPFEEEDWQPGPENPSEVPCNGHDEDGDGLDFCPEDADGDGTPVPYDCDDNDPTRYVAAVEILCDGIDQNCDGVDPCDSDGDGYLDSNDCDPADPDVTTQCLPPDEGAPLE